MRREKLLFVLSAGLVIGMFAMLALEKKPRSIAEGMWGGQHIQMSVANGSASIEYDCANGTISGPLRVDSRGRFSLLGKHVRERGGPTRLGEDQEGENARYTGWTDGKTMKLTVTLVETKTELGKFELTRGNPGRVFKCR
ncbi:MAG TPA: hypothetical protein VJT71_20295 [Pyrinomonadaceae bacterium]|nr:hypothetical protein [Pyrinomonadaceae bacterium]